MNSKMAAVRDSPGAPCVLDRVVVERLSASDRAHHSPGHLIAGEHVLNIYSRAQRCQSRAQLDITAEGTTRVRREEVVGIGSYQRLPPSAARSSGCEMLPVAAPDALRTCGYRARFERCGSVRHPRQICAHPRGCFLGPVTLVEGGNIVGDTSIGRTTKNAITAAPTPIKTLPPLTG
jgi:hypothetical protein